MGNPLIDSFLPKNELNSHKTIVLLQAHSMIIHSTVMVFMYNSSFSDYWVYFIVLFVVLLQLIIVIICLRIMHIYPSSTNAPFYIIAHLMILNILKDSLYTNYKMFKDNKAFDLKPRFSRLIYLFMYIFVICIFSSGVSYAFGEIEDAEPSSPVGEGNSFTRISQSGVPRFATLAGLYEGVSMVREWLETQVEFPSLKDEFEVAQQECLTAKEKLESIQFKYPSEQFLINKASHILKDGIKLSDLDVNQIKGYKETIEKVTIEMNAQYDTYTQYKSKTTDYLLRRLFGVNNCCCGGRVVKES
jgi:hypothetical protein